MLCELPHCRGWFVVGCSEHVRDIVRGIPEVESPLAAFSIKVDHPRVKETLLSAGVIGSSKVYRKQQGFLEIRRIGKLMMEKVLGIGVQGIGTGRLTKGARIFSSYVLKLYFSVKPSDLSR